MTRRRNRKGLVHAEIIKEGEFGLAKYLLRNSSSLVSRNDGRPEFGRRFHSNFRQKCNFRGHETALIRLHNCGRIAFAGQPSQKLCFPDIAKASIGLLLTQKVWITDYVTYVMRTQKPTPASPLSLNKAHFAKAVTMDIWVSAGVYSVTMATFTKPTWYPFSASTLVSKSSFQNTPLIAGITHVLSLGVNMGKEFENCPILVPRRH